MRRCKLIRIWIGLLGEPQFTEVRNFKLRRYPEHAKRDFFTPEPQIVSDCEIELRNGGFFYKTFPAYGNTMQNQGVVLKIWKDRMLGLTEGLMEAGIPEAELHRSSIILQKEFACGDTNHIDCACFRYAENRETGMGRNSIPAGKRL